MRRILYSVLVLLLMSQVCWSDDKSAAKELVMAKVEAALSVLQRKDLVQQEKNKQVVKIVEPIFDYNLMAKLTLGRKYWPGLSKKNIERNLPIFLLHG